MEALSQQTPVLPSARLLENHGASFASVGLLVPRLVRGIQTLGPERTPGSQNGTSQDDTQDDRLLTESR